MRKCPARILREIETLHKINVKMYDWKIGLMISIGLCDYRIGSANN
jgi:hypothetical protein